MTLTIHSLEEFNSKYSINLINYKYIESICRQNNWHTYCSSYFIYYYEDTYIAIKNRIMSCVLQICNYNLYKVNNKITLFNSLSQNRNILSIYNKEPKGFYNIFIAIDKTNKYDFNIIIKYLKLKAFQ